MTLYEEFDGSRGIKRQTIEDGGYIPNVAVFLKRTALEFLQILFNQRAIGSFHYDQDDTRSDILIADIHAVDLKTVGVRPAIIGVRGPLNWQDVGIGSIENRNQTTGDYAINGLLNGSIALSCVSREGIEAEQLAHLVFNSFKMFRPVLQKYGFFSIKGLSIGAETLVEQEGADDRTTIVPVYIGAQIQDRWIMDDTAARKLKQIIISHYFEVQK